MSNVVQRVGEKTRRDGRESAENRLERLLREREQLTMRKRDIEGRLNELDSKRKEEHANLYKRRKGNTDTIVESTMIESRFLGERSKLLKELNNVVEELAILKQSLRSASPRHPGDEILLRIEHLLTKILDRMTK